MPADLFRYASRLVDRYELHDWLHFRVVLVDYKGPK